MRDHQGNESPDLPAPRVTIRVDDTLDPDDPVSISVDIPGRHVTVAARSLCIDTDTAEEMTAVINQNIQRAWAFATPSAGEEPPAIIFRSDAKLRASRAVVLDEEDGVIAVLGRPPGFTDLGAEWFTRRVGEHLEAGYWSRRPGP